MIKPEMMAVIKSRARIVGDEILEVLTRRETSVNMDLAVVTYMYYAHMTAALKNRLADDEQRSEMIAVLDEVGAFAREIMKAQLLELGMLREAET